MGNREYKSPLGPKLAAYVSARRAQGCKFVTGEDVMHQLDAYAVRVGWEDADLGKELAEGFAAPRSGEAPRTRELRASAVRCLGAWLVNTGEAAYVLPRGYAPSSGKYKEKPRILTEDEVGRLLKAAEAMPRRSCSPLRHEVIPMMLRTIYACGLRISEACKLTVADVDLSEGFITVVDTKFNKSRRIPTSVELAERLRGYSERLSLDGRPASYPFFPSAWGFYRSSTVGRAFRALLHEASIPHYDDGPTLHSLRHSFAVHRLTRWLIEGENVAALLPYLSAYMGHEGLLGTERYLRMTVEMHPSLRKAMEDINVSVIPEVV